MFRRNDRLPAHVAQRRRGSPPGKGQIQEVFFLLVSKYCRNIIWVFFEYLNIIQIVSGINRLQKTYQFITRVLQKQLLMIILIDNQLMIVIMLKYQASIESMQSSDSRLCYLTSSEVRRSLHVQIKDKGQEQHRI